jgi:predicted helicase
MTHHVGYELVEPYPLTRTDVPDEKARSVGQAPKAILKADKVKGRIQLDSETTLSDIPADAWEYKLGNRLALEWVLDQHKEKKPKDPIIREKFNTYRLDDHKETVIDLLMRVVTVSVYTAGILKLMKAAPR